MLGRLLLAALLLAGCYGKPSLPDVPEPPGVSPTPDASVPRPTPPPEPPRQAVRADQLEGVLARLSETGDRPAPERDGAATWRAAELEKLHELLVSCCAAEDGPCRACSEQIGSADLPAAEVWPLAGRFLQGLRPRAAFGLPALVTPLLGSPTAQHRDRAYRLLVGAGIVTRSELDDSGHAAAAWPPSPAAGDPAWVIVERIAPCPEGTAAFKGPDPTGRLDAVIEPTCPDVTPDPTVLTPRVHRIVAATRIDALPASGLTVFAAGGARELLRVRPRPESEKIAPPDPPR